MAPPPWKRIDIVCEKEPVPQITLIYQFYPPNAETWMPFSYSGSCQINGKNIRWLIPTELITKFDRIGDDTLFKVAIPMAPKLIEKIESMRDKGNHTSLELVVTIQFLATYRTEIMRVPSQNIDIIKVEESKWLKFLDDIDYGTMRTFILTLPKKMKDIELLSEACNHIDMALKSKAQGDNIGALKHVRDGLEKVYDFLKKEKPVIIQTLDCGSKGEPGRQDRSTRYLGPTFTGDSKDTTYSGLLDSLWNVVNMTHPYYRIEAWDVDLTIYTAIGIINLIGEELRKRKV